MPRVKFTMRRFKLADYESSPSDFNPEEVSLDIWFVEGMVEQ